MDFSRARTVLIGMFLFLNLFLLYQIWQDEGRGDFAFPGRKEEASRLEIALNTAGFSLDTSLPRGDMRLAHLEVEPWQFDAAELLSTLWAIWEKGKDPPPVEEETSAKNYFCGGYSLHVEKEGLLVFTAKSKRALGQKIDNEEAELKMAQEAVQGVSFMQGFVYDYTRKTEKGTALYFRQEYEGYPLYGGYAKLEYGGKSEIVFSLYRLKPRGFAAQEREIISPTAALLRFLEMDEMEPGKGGQKRATTKKKSIADISLGYYSHGYDAERWEAPPVWRIRLGSGEVYYINAFTGILER